MLRQNFQLPMRLILLIVQILFAASLLRPFPTSAEDTNDRIAAEISRLQQTLRTNPITDPDLAPVVDSVSQDLTEASAALESGKFFLSLEKLLQAENLLSAARFPNEKTEAVKSSYPAFEAEWKTVSQTVTSVNQQSHAKDWSRSPAAVRALAETALARSVPLLDGGRGFALSTKPADGLFYLGQAQGEAASANFASSLTMQRNGAPFPLRSFLPELQALQRKTNQAFKPPRSVEFHQRFIALNSALKLAQELDAQKSYAGSLYQYLEAVRHFGMLEAAPVAVRNQPSLKEAASAAQKKFAGSKNDDSILQIFLERAVSQSHMPRLPPRVPTTNGAALKSFSTASSPHISPRKSLPPCLQSPMLKPPSSLSSAGPTLETSPTRQVCWYRKWPLNIPDASPSSVKISALPP